MEFVAYYRVSTKEQGVSGLGIQSQKDSVRDYIKSVDGILLEEFTDIESGGNVDREGLNDAINLCEDSGAVLVVKKLDRLSRDGFEVSTKLEKKNIRFIECASPHDNALIKNIKLAMAKEEKEVIGKRIVDSMAVIRDNIKRDGYHISKAGNKITSLGKPENLGGEIAMNRSIAVRKKRALTNPNNIRARAVITLLYDAGRSFYWITKFLNDNMFRTSKNNKFSQVQVKSLYAGDKLRTKTKN